MAGAGPFDALIASMGNPFQTVLAPGFSQTAAPASQPTQVTEGNTGGQTNPVLPAGGPTPAQPASGAGQYPNAIWGGNDNIASHTPPKWMVDMVNAYLANPTHDRWNHILNGPVAPQYNVAMPDWLHQWLVQAMGPDPSITSKGGI